MQAATGPDTNLRAGAIENALGDLNARGDRFRNCPIGSRAIRSPAVVRFKRKVESALYSRTAAAGGCLSSRANKDDIVLSAGVPSWNGLFCSTGALRFSRQIGF